MFDALELTAEVVNCGGCKKSMLYAWLENPNVEVDE